MAGARKIEAEDGTPQFSFAQVRSILARLQEIDNAKLRTFEARLQQLQKLGLPKGTNVGRSGRARYDYWQIAELDAYLCLIDAGATPAVLAARFSEEPLYAAIRGRDIENASQGEDEHLSMRFGTLAPLRSQSRPDGVFSGYGPPFFKSLSDQPSIVINLTRRVQLLKAAVSEILPQFAGQHVFIPDPFGQMSDGPA